MTIAAPAERVWAALLDVDFGRSPVIRWLFRLRGLPSTTLRIDGLRRLRFVPLELSPPRRYALGIIGRFWTPGGALRKFSPESFTMFDEPDFAKALWSFEIEPLPEGCRLKTETHVRCTSPRARRRFRIYWALVGPFSGWIRREILRLVKRGAESGVR